MTLATDDLLVFGCWIKAASTWPKALTMKLSFRGSRGLSSIESIFLPTEEWQYVRAYSVVEDGAHVNIDAATAYFNVAVNTGFSDIAQVDNADVDFYIDCASLYRMPAAGDNGYKYLGASGFQPGGTPKTDESASIIISDVGSDSTVMASWWPNMWYDAWSNGDESAFYDIPLFTIPSDNSEELTVFYDSSEGKITATDGTNTATVASIFGPADQVNIAVVFESSKFTLYVQTPNDTFASNASAANVLSSPTAIVIGGSAGYWMNIKAYDVILTSGEVEDALGAVEGSLGPSLHSGFFVQGGFFN
jgi:hypothetical protein